MRKRSVQLQIRQQSILANTLLLLLVCLLFSGNISAADPVCDSTYVQLSASGTFITVTPNHSDDTANIQCALDMAVSMGVPTVKLQAETYYIGSLKIEGFKGTFEGQTRAGTVIEVLDGAFNCYTMRRDGYLPAAIKFIKGEPRIRYMTINAHRTCLYDRRLNTILHITGEFTAADNCDNDVVFGVVDRVMINGTSSETGPLAAIEVAPEGRDLGGCKDTLLGTFKLNRSYIENTHAGVITNMKSGAQVDINFNEFRGNLQAINVFDSNQNTNIVSNKVYGDNSSTWSYYGVYLMNFNENAPKSTRLVVHNNEFNILSTFDRTNYAVRVKSEDISGSVDVPNISTVITSNRFNLNGEDVYGIQATDVSNGHISANRFSGFGRRAIYIAGGHPLSGWTITANNGLADFMSDYGDHIRFHSNTSMCIVGPDQDATVEDLGSNTVILPQ